MTFNDLPFVACDSDGNVTSTWNVTPSGDWSADCATGRAYFDKMWDVMATEGTQPLSRVIEGQVRAGQWGGIEVGFHVALGQVL